MKSNKDFWNTDKESAEDSSFGTGSNPEMNSQIKGLTTLIISHEYKPEGEAPSIRCDKCRRQVKRTYELRGKATPRCSDCLFTRRTEKSTERTNEEKNPEPRRNRVIRLFRCYRCNSPVGFDRLTSCPVICKDCLQLVLSLDAKAAERLIERVLQNIGIHLRRWA